MTLEQVGIFMRISQVVFRILSFPFTILSYFVGAVKFCVSPKYAARSYYLSFSSQTLENVVPLISADEAEWASGLAQDSKGLIKKTYIYLLGAAHEMGEDKNMSQDEITGMFTEMFTQQPDCVVLWYMANAEPRYAGNFVEEVMEESESDEGRYLFLEGRTTVKAMLGEYFGDAPSKILEILHMAEAMMTLKLFSKAVLSAMTISTTLTGKEEHLDIHVLESSKEYLAAFVFLWGAATYLGRENDIYRIPEIFTVIFASSFGVDMFDDTSHDEEINEMLKRVMSVIETKAGKEFLKEGANAIKDWLDGDTTAPSRLSYMVHNLNVDND